MLPYNPKAKNMLGYNAFVQFDSIALMWQPCSLSNGQNLSQKRKDQIRYRVFNMRFGVGGHDAIC